MGQTSTINVSTAAQLNDAVAKWAGDGYTVTSQTSDMATLKKTAAENIFANIVVVGLLLILCIVPGLVYIAVLGAKGDLLVVIRVDPAAAASEAAAGTIEGLRWSEDRVYWWDTDASVWIDAGQTMPPTAQISDDRSLWWDGEGWRPVPATTDRAADSADEQTG